MINFKNSLVATAVLALALGGCGDDRSHPAGVDQNGVPIVYANPTAIIDLNATTHVFVEVLGEYTVDRTNLGNPFIFTGTKSHDNDENNQSIATYAWSIAHSFTDACVDVNTSNNQAVFKFLHTDTNATCTQEATDSGEINATLIVTDDEGKTAAATRSIKTN